MGGDDSQKLGPGEDSSSPPGRSKPPVHSQRSTVTKLGRTMTNPATAGVGHFWRARPDHFSKAPKLQDRLSECAPLFKERHAQGFSQFELCAD